MEKKILVLSGWDDPEYKTVLSENGNLTSFGKGCKAEAKKLGINKIRWDFACKISNRYAGYAIVPGDFETGLSCALTTYDESEWKNWSAETWDKTISWIKSAKRKGAGRPKTENPRNKRFLTIQVTEDELELLESQVKASGKSKSSWAREKILKAI